MPEINLNWNFDDQYDSFSIYRSNKSIDSANLPEAIADNVIGFNYIDHDVIPGVVYYYKIVAFVNNYKIVGKELKAIASVDLEPELNVSILPYAFWKLNETSGDFIDSSGNNNTLVASTTVKRNQTSIDPTTQVSSQVDSTSSVNDKYIGTFTSTETANTDFTVSFWMSVPANTTATSGEFFKMDLENGKGFSIGFGTGSDGVAPANGRFLQVGQNSIAFRSTSLSFTNVAQNAHIVLRWRSGYLEMFLNGVLKSSRSVGNYATAKKSIGVGKGEADFRPTYDIAMSRVAVYNAAISNADITKIYNITKIQS